jgi:hypothetical protein
MEDKKGTKYKPFIFRLKSEEKEKYEEKKCGFFSTLT